MRRILVGGVGVAAFVLACSLAACGQKTQSSAPVDTTLTASSAPAPASSSVADAASSSAADTSSSEPVAAQDAITIGGQGDKYVAFYTSTFMACAKDYSLSSDCYLPEAEIQDAKLAATYKHLMASATPDDQIAIRNAERLWIKTRDRQCDSDMASNGGDDAHLAHDMWHMCELWAIIDRNNFLTSHIGKPWNDN